MDTVAGASAHDIEIGSKYLAAAERRSFDAASRLLEFPHISKEQTMRCVVGDT
jgi:hypothetical protein